MDNNNNQNYPSSQNTTPPNRQPVAGSNPQAFGSTNNQQNWQSQGQNQPQANQSAAGQRQQVSTPPQPPQKAAENPNNQPANSQTVQQSQQNVPGQSPPGTSFPPPPKKKFPVKIIVILAVAFLLIAGSIVAASFLLSPGQEDEVVSDQVFRPQPTEAAGPTEHVAQEYEDFEGVQIDENTVAFNKVDESFRIRYLGQIFHEQDTGKFRPREVFPQTADQFEWYGLIDTPEDVVGEPELFSFKAPPTYQSFIFIMRWDRSEGQRYEMFRFHDNQVTKLYEFKEGESTYFVPVVDSFSLGGNFVSLKLFSCAECFDENPEVFLYHIPTGETRNIGRVSYFAWGDEDNTYEYREYIEGQNPENAPIRKNQFFEESEDVLSS